MIYVFILLIMIIVDFQIIALYRYNRDRFEKTKDEKDTTEIVLKKQRTRKTCRRQRDGLQALRVR